MDDTASNQNPPKDFNKLDLTQLQGFSFGTQWTQDKNAPREGRRDEHPRRGDSGTGDPKRDRRGFRKPAGPISEAAPGSAPVPGRDPRDNREGGGGGGGEFRGNRGEYRGGGGGGGPRRDGPGGGGGGGGEFRGGQRFAPR